MKQLQKKIILTLVYFGFATVVKAQSVDYKVSSQWATNESEWVKADISSTFCYDFLEVVIYSKKIVNQGETIKYKYKYEITNNSNFSVDYSWKWSFGNNGGGSLGKFSPGTKRKDVTFETTEIHPTLTLYRVRFEFSGNEQEKYGIPNLSKNLSCKEDFSSYLNDYKKNKERDEISKLKREINSLGDSESALVKKKELYKKLDKLDNNNVYGYVIREIENKLNEIKTTTDVVDNVEKEEEPKENIVKLATKKDQDISKNSGNSLLAKYAKERKRNQAIDDKIEENTRKAREREGQKEINRYNGMSIQQKNMYRQQKAHEQRTKTISDAASNLLGSIMGDMDSYWARVNRKFKKREEELERAREKRKRVEIIYGVHIRKLKEEARREKSIKWQLKRAEDEKINWTETSGLAKYYEKEKCGFVNQSHIIVIPPVFDEVKNFKETIAPVKIKGKWGFIDYFGYEVSPAKYDEVGSFNEGIAKVKLNGKWGFIDVKGKEITPIQYEQVGDFKNGLSVIRKNNQPGYVNYEGKEFMFPKYDYVFDFNDNIALVQKNEKRGYINIQGEEIIPVRYNTAFNFKDGIGIVELNGKRGYIDKEGKEITPLKYDNAYSSQDGVAIVKLNNKFGYINKDGKEITPLKYDFAYPMYNGISLVSVNNKFGFINKEGREILPVTIKKAYSSGGYTTENAHNYIFINKKGNIEKLEDIYSWSNCSTSMCIVKDTKYNWYAIIKGEKYNVRHTYWNKDKGRSVAFKEGIAILEKDGKVGAIDKNGEFIIPVKYDEMTKFLNGVSVVKLNGKYGLVDWRGKLLTPIKYDDYNISVISKYTAFKENDKWGLLDSYGKLIVPFGYYDLMSSEFAEGRVSVQKDNKWGCIDVKGNLIVPYKYTKDFYYRGAFAEVFKGKKSTMIDIDGIELLPFKNYDYIVANYLYVSYKKKGKKKIVKVPLKYSK